MLLRFLFTKMVDGPIVYRLGQRLFKPLRGVRLPLGLLNNILRIAPQVFLLEHRISCVVPQAKLI